MDTVEKILFDKDPSPSEITKRCRIIQQTWSSAERERRSVIKNKKWLPAGVPEYVKVAVLN